MHTFKFLSMAVLAFTFLVNAHSSDINKGIDDIIIEYTPNHLYYIHYNNTRTLIEDADEELSNGKLMKLTNGCIDIDNIYETDKGMTINGCRINKACNLFVKNSSDVKHYKYTLHFSKDQSVPLKLCADTNTAVDIYSDPSSTLLTDKLIIEPNAKVNQYGKMFVKCLNSKVNSLLSIHGTLIL